ncbi:MAG: hypothetical protein K2L87_00240 [Clostridiales bacterium]|nr:hypothetical protein [Clostridiales bacterium]
MKKGFVIQVDGIEYVIALCTPTKSGNVAILLRRSGNRECLTVSNLKPDIKGKYSWELGYPAESYDDAVNKFMTRVTA